MARTIDDIFLDVLVKENVLIEYMKYRIKELRYFDDDEVKDLVLNYKLNNTYFKRSANNLFTNYDLKIHLKLPDHTIIEVLFYFYSSCKDEDPKILDNLIIEADKAMNSRKVNKYISRVVPIWIVREALAITTERKEEKQ